MPLLSPSPSPDSAEAEADELSAANAACLARFLRAERGSTLAAVCGALLSSPSLLLSLLPSLRRISRARFAGREDNPSMAPASGPTLIALVVGPSACPRLLLGGNCPSAVGDFLVSLVMAGVARRLAIARIENEG